MYYLRTKGKYNPSNTYTFSTVDYYYNTLIHNIWDIHFETNTLASKAIYEETILEYINGYRMHVVVSWFTVDNIFILINMKERLHLVLIVVYFNERSIIVYDSLRGSIRDSYVLTEIKKICTSDTHVSFNDWILSKERIECTFTSKIQIARKL